MYFTLKRLSNINRDAVLAHFLRLDTDSKSSRFCSNYSTENLIKYVEKIDFKNGICIF